MRIMYRRLKLWKLNCRELRCREAQMLGGSTVGAQLSQAQLSANHTMLPFGSGSRACIGQGLAFLELKATFVRLMQRRVIFEDTMQGGPEVTEQPLIADNF